MNEAFAEGFEAQAAWGAAIHWPSPKYQKDPDAFAREILGVTPWARQREVLEAVAERPRVAVRSGHKVGKSNSAALLALWFYCSFEDARVIMTSVTSRQVETILWREVRRVLGKALVEIDGDVHEVARSGLKALDFREIQGFTAKEPEAVAGPSGANILYIVDEASGVPEEIFEAIEGNSAGGARIAMFSNPTRTIGTFFRAFHKDKAFWFCIHISSLESPNVVEGRAVIPGLATRDWAERNRARWGEKSNWYQVRVLGNFPILEEGRTLSIAAIEDSQNRWEIVSNEGRLSIGIDPAGEGLDGDEAILSAVRGARQLVIEPHRGASPSALLVYALDLIKTHGRSTEIPRVVVDSEHQIGWDVYREFKAYIDAKPGAFELVRVRASRAPRQIELFRSRRDELWASLVHWIERGGAILDDEKLSEELHAPLWTNVELGKGSNRGRVVRMLTPKNELRAILKRSPDRADALALAVWDQDAQADDELELVAGPVAKARAAVDLDEDLAEGGAMDPFAGRDAWGHS